MDYNMNIILQDKERVTVTFETTFVTGWIGFEVPKNKEPIKRLLYYTSLLSTNKMVPMLFEATFVTMADFLT